MSSGEIFASFSARHGNAERAIALFGGLRDVVSVAGHAVADNFRNDLRAASLGEFELFENQNARRLRPTTNPSRSRVKRPAGALRLVIARVKARAWRRIPPMPMGVTAASAPPAIITSAAQRWMIL